MVRRKHRGQFSGAALANARLYREKHSAKLRAMSPRLFGCWIALILSAMPARATRDLIATHEIRKKCAQIDAQTQKATRQTAIVLEMSHDGSEITALNLAGQTRKLHVTHLSTMGRQQETIYLEDGRPIWVTQIRTVYDAPYSGRTAQREEEDLYFQKGQLIQRDFRPMAPIGRPRQRRFIHQTFVASASQARNWKAKAIEWCGRVERYQRELKTKQPLPTSAAAAAKATAASAA